MSNVRRAFTTPQTATERYMLHCRNATRAKSDVFVAVSNVYCLCVSLRQQDVVKKRGAEDLQQRATERPMGEESSEHCRPVQAGG